MLGAGASEFMSTGELEDDGLLPELVDFGLHADRDFCRRVCRAIHRREAAASFVDLFSHGVLAVMTQWLELAAHVGSPPEEGGD